MQYYSHNEIATGNQEREIYYVIDLILNLLQLIQTSFWRFVISTYTKIMTLHQIHQLSVPSFSRLFQNGTIEIFEN